MTDYETGNGRNLGEPTEPTEASNEQIQELGGYLRQRAGERSTAYNLEPSDSNFESSLDTHIRVKIFEILVDPIADQNPFVSGREGVLRRMISRTFAPELQEIEKMSVGNPHILGEAK